MLLILVLRVICWFSLYLLALMYREVNKHACVCVCVLCFQELDFAFEDLEDPPGFIYEG